MNQTIETTQPALPTGTLTFLFTDVEGSTRLWDLFPEQMRTAMARHDRLIESTVAGHHGSIVRPRGEGDSRFAVFPRASDAVAAAITIQRLMHSEEWPMPAPIRVRAALHTGEADLRAGDYYGNAVNRCARLRSIAHGDQTLLSQATFDLVQETLPGGVRLKDLGTHNLKDLNRSEHIYQIVAAGLPSDFPPLNTASTFHTNLPVAINSFIGRKNELVEINLLLGSNRLLSIVGPGGAGKTRLALQAASSLVDIYKDGIWLVDLAPLSSPSLLVQHINKVLGLREAEIFPPVQILVEYLADKNMLLVLDNCEHLLPSVTPLVEMLLHSAAKLGILATSREPLGLTGERTWPIPPLSSPELKSGTALDQLVQFEAVKLFIDRASAVRPDFAVTEENMAALAQICARLDGNPLAIELAAARVRVLSLEEIARRLDDRFHLLVGAPTANPRQQTLQALIDWSYDLLSEDERTLLRRLSVFKGGWNLAAAEEVCSGGEIGSVRVMDLLAHLVDKSLVVSETYASERRFHFLETILKYSQNQLENSDEPGEYTFRYVQYFLQLAEQSYGALWGPRQGYCPPINGRMRCAGLAISPASTEITTGPRPSTNKAWRSSRISAISSGSPGRWTRSARSTSTWATTLARPNSTRRA
jgi:predicted ATPase/class 3 adenylate cyclase